MPANDHMPRVSWKYIQSMTHLHVYLIIEHHFAALHLLELHISVLMPLTAMMVER